MLPARIDGTAPIRFTSKMLFHLRHGELVEADNSTIPYFTEAFDRLVSAVYERHFAVRLLPGQLLVFDQWRYAHGRLPLGTGQEAIPPGQRRLLKQGYVGQAGLGGAL